MFTDVRNFEIKMKLVENSKQPIFTDVKNFKIEMIFVQNSKQPSCSANDRPPMQKLKGCPLKLGLPVR